MPKGGARTRSGPAPDPNALCRERDEGEWTRLPATGRQGDPPTFPLPGLTDRESVVWADLWRLPQALMWERQHQETYVALYVRRMCEAELPDTPVALSTLCRQMADSLGLTTPGIRANRWTIDAVEVETKRQGPASASDARRPSLSVVGQHGAA